MQEDAQDQQKRLEREGAAAVLTLLALLVQKYKY
jgi:hypothetical protein